MTRAHSQADVLVTGAGGFVGGHVARWLARAGYAVRGLARTPPFIAENDPAIEWIIGDLLDPETPARVVADVSHVIHAAGWVSLGPDHAGRSHQVNVAATDRLLHAAQAGGVQSFVYTSTLYTLAAGRPESPADESTPWNLERIDSPYTRSKRQAESLVLRANSPSFRTMALCPGMVLGERDPKPTSTAVVRALASHAVAFLPGGGIPIVDAEVLAQAHARALERGEGGARYAVVGPYLSYPQLASIVQKLTGKPRVILPVPDLCESPMALAMALLGPVIRRAWPDASPMLVAGSFLRLHVSGAKANSLFELIHPPPEETISRAFLPGTPAGKSAPVETPPIQTANLDASPSWRG